MEMGTPKPLQLSRTSVSAVSVEAGLSSRPISRQADAAMINSSIAPIATQSPDAVQQSAEVNRNALDTAVTDIQDFVQSVSRNIDFQIDDSSGRVVINVTERSSGDVIRQIPSEEALRLAENLSQIRSVLFEAEA
ncbi:flagellar protein FlaG [Halopseudomonas xinjiangensis]|uniref:Flagellar protein FlaG n=1 Tax=Halopseudomonas xinjiangensis TaxID=487184 RepID=A0A1H1MNW0_9GAMM|nr:flagellar protein FlaG [Halopseudomonas xinjiangensis]SDR88310.1 flagellar protein FlaG [Halopseudomonas xinjiangensis]